MTIVRQAAAAAAAHCHSNVSFLSHVVCLLFRVADKQLEGTVPFGWDNGWGEKSRETSLILLFA